MNRFFFAILLFAVIGSISFSLLNNDKTPETTAQLLIPNNIDYYLKNTQQKSFNTDGAIDFTLNTQLIEHYKREDKSKMINPDIQISRKTQWQIKAQQGNFFHPTEIITFNDNVLLDKHSNQASFKVLSEYLRLDIKQDLVISDSNVKVTANNWNISAKTMTLDIKNEVHQFTQVTARYRNDKNS
jgi:LPS export ABC transporter protein LptC